MTEKDTPRVPPPPAEPIVPQPGNSATRPPAGGKRLSLQEAMALAQRLEATGELDKAEQILRQVLLGQPEHVGALHLLSVVSHRLGQGELALQLIDQAIAQTPDNALFHSNKGEICRVLARLDEAIASGERAVALNPNMVAAISNIGIAYYDQENYEKAEEFQLRALEIDPNFLAALNNLGSVRRSQKDIAAAIECYRKALAVNPDYVEGMNNLGAVFTEDDRPEEAIKLLLQAVRKRPAYADLHCNLAKICNPVVPAANRFATAESRIQCRRPEEWPQLFLDEPRQEEIDQVGATANNEQNDAVWIGGGDHVPDHEIEQDRIGDGQRQHQNNSHHGGRRICTCLHIVVHRSVPSKPPGYR